MWFGFGGYFVFDAWAGRFFEVVVRTSGGRVGVGLRVCSGVSDDTRENKKYSTLPRLLNTLCNTTCFPSTSSTSSFLSNPRNSARYNSTTPV